MTTLSKSAQKLNEIAEELIRLIREDKTFIEKLFRTINGELIIPMNHEGKPYRGINAWSLATLKTPIYVTYRQAQKQGTFVKKGAISNQILFSSPVLDENDEIVRMNYKWFRVFNIEYIDNPNAFPTYNQFMEFKNSETEGIHKPIDRCEQLIQKLNPLTESSPNQPSYNEKKDLIKMPELQRFNTPEQYYSTYFHEIGHWTKHETRCNRSFGEVDYSNKHKDKNYAKEEFVAETVAAFLTTIFNIEKLESNAAYIQHYLNKFKNDGVREFMSTISKAQKAVEYICENGGISTWTPKLNE